MLDPGDAQWHAAIDTVPKAETGFTNVSVGYRRGIGGGLELGGRLTWRAGAALQGKLRLLENDKTALAIGLGVDYATVDEYTPLFTYRDQPYDGNLVGSGLGVQAPVYLSHDLWPVLSLYGALTPKWEAVVGSASVVAPVAEGEPAPSFTISNDLRVVGVGWTIGGRVGRERFGVFMEATRLHFHPLGGYTPPIELQWWQASGAIYF